MEIKFKVDIKTVRRAFVLLGLKIPSDEALENKFASTVVDLSDSKDEDIQRAELGYVLMAIGIAYGE